MGNGTTVQAGKRATYPAYKPSGTPWLGDVPEHWEVRRLKYSADLINQKVDGAEADLPYMGLEHIESWTGKRLGQNGDASSDGQANLFRRGDVLFGKLRPYLAKAYAADSEGICTGELLVLRPKAVEQKFLLDYVLNLDFVTIVDSSTYGAKMPRANWDFIGNLPTLIPPRDEQKAIAAFLDRETARIDALIEKKQRQIELLQEKRSALISHAVTKGLDPNAPTKDSGIEWLGEIPKHWEACPIKRVSMRIQTGCTPPTAEERYYDDGSVHWYGPGSFGTTLVLSQPIKLLNESAIREGAARLFAADSIMIVCIGATIGKVGYLAGPASSNQQITAITPNAKKASGKFLAYQLKRLEHVLRGIAPSTTLPIMDQQEVGYLPCALPPLEEQDLIIEYLDRLLQNADAMTRRIHESIDMLREHRAALIAAAVTGNIDVRGEV